MFFFNGSIASSTRPSLTSDSALPYHASSGVLFAAVSVTRTEPATFVEKVLVTGSLVAREEILVGPEVEGLRVIDVAQVRSGPTCVKQFADFGADVIRIESPPASGRVEMVTGPRDGAENHGPMEKAFIGAPVENPDFPVELAQVAHSYDSCLVCTVHAYDGKTGRELAKFRMGGG